MIGIFDSGIGGLTVARAVGELLPQAAIRYFGDTARTPYGTKSAETVINYSIENTEFLLDQGAKVIVVACNTASAVAMDALRERFDVPFFEVITPAVEMALSLRRCKRIGVIGTRATVGSGVYERMIRAQEPSKQVFSQPCPLLVPLVEEGWLNRPETRMIVKKYLHPLKVRQIDALILGCTHYPVIKHLISQKIGKRVQVISSSEAVGAHLVSFLEQNREMASQIGDGGGMDIFVSDVTDQFKKTAGMILKQRMPRILKAG